MIIVSHRGPYAFSFDHRHELQAQRGAGGLVSALGPLLHGGINGADDTPTWIAAAISDADRHAARTGTATLPGVNLVLLDLPIETHRLHYDVVSNSVLWFLHHQIFDLVRRPAFGPEFTHAWAAYREVNARFASEVCTQARPGEIVFVQDYQLALVGTMVQHQRPDLRVMQFSHIPFCPPETIRVLPDAIAEEYCAAMSPVVTGFHAQRWADAYRASVHTILGHEPKAITFVQPLGTDPHALDETLASDDAVDARAWLAELRGPQALITRTDRLEPTKNIVRGLDAYELFLATHPEWRERVMFLLRCYPSRERIPEYQQYAALVQSAVDRINTRFASERWEPVVFDTDDNFARSVVALEQADIIMANSLMDGQNLVALEAPAINTHNGIVLGSTNIGAIDVLGSGIIAVNPFDITDTADAIARILTMPTAQRSAIAAQAKVASARVSPELWLAGCLANAPGEGS